MTTSNDLGRAVAVRTAVPGTRSRRTVRPRPHDGGGRRNPDGRAPALLPAID